MKTNPLEVKIPFNDETVVPNAVGENPIENIMLRTSHSISLFSVISCMSNQLKFERVKWR